jgi:hypothetical protein
VQEGEHSVNPSPVAAKRAVWVDKPPFLLAESAAKEIVFESDVVPIGWAIDLLKNGGFAFYLSKKRGEVDVIWAAWGV